MRVLLIAAFLAGTVTLASAQERACEPMAMPQAADNLERIAASISTKTASDKDAEDLRYMARCMREGNNRILDTIRKNK